MQLFVLERHNQHHQSYSLLVESVIYYRIVQSGLIISLVFVQISIYCSQSAIQTELSVYNLALDFVD